jgi:NADPH-dependent 2,4-dienoyl-CoA reductase/sulfur reductase-like enzyme/peroxiredoxin family protein/rhodanese-related sulfurtransferase/TusA-related sulfurtransferase
MSISGKKRILIVGGVAGGASFAARMRRLDEQAEIVMFEKGGYISFANCGLPYHIGNVIKDRENLIIQTPEAFRKRFNIDVRINSEVMSVDSVNKNITVRYNGRDSSESYDYLVLAPGAHPIRPPVTGIGNEKILTLRNIADMDAINDRLKSESVKRVVVVGGGFIGLEMAENLRHRGLEVVLIELSEQVFVPADREMANVLHQHLLINGIDLVLKDGVKEFSALDSGRVKAVLNSGAVKDADMVILAIGVKPDTDFLKSSGISTTARGAIIVDEHMRTSADSVYAVGDAVEVTDLVSGQKVMVPLAGPANRMGRIAADNIAGLASRYKNTQGTAICKIFDLTAAVTGLSEKSALRWGIPYVKSYTHSSSHAGYYPGAYPMSVKILFSPDTGRLLGAQIIGTEGVDKRIDVFAAALRHELTVYDLSDLELAYAPPYGSAKDAVNIAGFVAQNILEKRMPVVYSENIATLVRSENFQLLDVRTKDECETGTIDGSIIIPVDDLRARMNELDKSRPVAVYCQVGLRAYVAIRILRQSGFDARNLSGGYNTYRHVIGRDIDLAILKQQTEPSCSSPVGESREKKISIDARGLQCPGPIMKLKEAVDRAGSNDTVEITASDQGFALDVPSWCTRTNNTLVSLSHTNGAYVANVRKGAPQAVCSVPQDREHQKTMVIFSNDMDKMMAAFIIANGSAAMGSKVTLFFTFWGLNLLRKDVRVPVKKSILEAMFGIMMPRGPGKTVLSKMNMAGIGTALMKFIMRKKNVYTLDYLIQKARENGVRFVACTMSMDIMGIKKEELIDGIEFGGVTYYLERADNSAYNLFI